jgi:hypothetical protein
MNGNLRWDPCVSHRGAEAVGFLNHFFTDASRVVLLVAGSGFDPRALAITKLLAPILRQNITGLFIREQRPSPSKEMLAKAEENQRRMCKLVAHHEVVEIAIFAADGAVIGGKEIVKRAQKIAFQGFTDVLIDASALSTGIMFPLVGYLLKRAHQAASNAFNLHLLVIDDPDIDKSIVSVGDDTAMILHGFKGGFGLNQSLDSVKLWMPQLVLDQHSTLRKIHALVNPDYVCPILPFPSRNPRFGDELIEHYEEELLGWGVDHRNIVYASDEDPLDLYRTILQLDAVQSRVFKDVGGSLTIVSPLGSKLLAMGALMAAIDRNFPVVSVESLSYKTTLKGSSVELPIKDDIFHLWLSGEAYMVNAQKTVVNK